MTDLKIVRLFNVAPKIVFDAFTKPEAMRVWWTDDTEFDMDLRVGGTWTITREEDGTTFTMTGKYLEVDRPHRLKYTISMPQFSPNSDIVSVDIEAKDKDGCKVTFIQSGPDITEELKALPEGEISQSEQGWQQGFDLMEKAWK
ncbi:MAG: SRPBCC domain-containing protein [Gracilimonas sp.]